jgi:hypothetical protein
MVTLSIDAHKYSHTGVAGGWVGKEARRAHRWHNQ